MNTSPTLTPDVLRARVNALVAHFGRVQRERMVGLPLLNPVLQVEAVGFEWGAQEDPAACPVAEGVLITPWFMSLVRLPALVLAPGNQVTRSTVRCFGQDRFDFIGAHDVSVGYHETCALFSPMFGFSHQAHARETALASLALTRAAPETPLAPQVPQATPAPAVHPARRAFLLGRTAGATP